MMRETCEQQRISSKPTIGPLDGLVAILADVGGFVKVRICMSTDKLHV